MGKIGQNPEQFQKQVDYDADGRTIQKVRLNKEDYQQYHVFLLHSTDNFKFLPCFWKRRDYRNKINIAHTAIYGSRVTLWSTKVPMSPGFTQIWPWSKAGFVSDGKAVHPFPILKVDM